MGIFIKNPDVEERLRQLAALRGESITGAVDHLVRDGLEQERAKAKPRPTIEEMKAATAEFRRKAGLDKVKLNVTKADFDALWEIPGFDPEDRSE